MSWESIGYLDESSGPVFADPGIHFNEGGIVGPGKVMTNHDVEQFVYRLPEFNRTISVSFTVIADRMREVAEMFFGAGPFARYLASLAAAGDARHARKRANRRRNRLRRKRTARRRRRG